MRDCEETNWNLSVSCQKTSFHVFGRTASTLRFLLPWCFTFCTNTKLQQCVFNLSLLCIAPYLLLRGFQRKQVPKTLIGESDKSAWVFIWFVLKWHCAVLWQRHEIQLRLHSPQEVLRFNNNTETWCAIPSPVYSMAFGCCCKCALKWVSAWLCKLFL